MDIKLQDNKSYEEYSVSNDASIFSGYYGDYSIDLEIRQRLAKELGFSYDLYTTLHDIDDLAADSLVYSMSTHSKHPTIHLLKDEEEKKILGYSLDDRAPILNKDFLHRVISLADACDEVGVAEIHYHKDDTISSIILKKKSPIVIEIKYEGRESEFVNYNIGVVIINDELTSAYTRLVLYVDEQPLYLPATYYNTTTSRYKRSTSNSKESLELLVLKVIEDLRENYLYNKLYDFHYRYRANKDILATYEEYNLLLRTMRKIPTVIEDNSFLEVLLNEYENFEKTYPKLEDQKSSYIWRCTAMSNITVGELVKMTIRLLSNIGAPPIEYAAIRELLGGYVSTNRIAEEIAKEELR